MVSIDNPVGGPEQVNRGGYGGISESPKGNRSRDCLVSLRMNQRGSGESTVGLPTDGGELLRMTMPPKS